MYICIIFFPLFGAIASGLFGKYLGRNGSIFFSTFFIFFSLLISLYSFLNLLKYNFICKIILGDWVNNFFISIKWVFLFDSVTIIMLIVVTFVSFIVHLYSIDYMREDPFLPTFMSYLSLFTFFMLMLITSNNLLQLFLGWEGVGICSYLLISFWFTRVEALKSALKAIMVNKIGDYFLFLGIILTYFSFHSIDYGTLFNLIEFLKFFKINFFNIEFHLLSVISFFFLLAAVGKSAQIGLHTWLPDAMEGPTPVSALIHAATMVTAGIFLIIRCSFFFEYSPSILALMVFFGALTAFLGGSIALLQVDIKKIIAYSTCSQLGYMMFSCGLSSYNVALYHLLNHAFFKALLFLSAGVIIHSIFDEQDLRVISVFGKSLISPITVWFLSIGSLAIMGFPGMSGFFSKDKIIELAYANNSFVGFFAFFFGVLTAFLTAFYSFRLLFLVFFNSNQKMSGNNLNIYSYSIFIKLKNLHNNIHMFLGMFFLGLGSVFSGYLLEEIFAGFGSKFFDNSLPSIRNSILMINIEYIPLFIKFIPLFMVLFGAISSYCLLSLFWKESSYLIYNFKYLYYLMVFLLKKWNFDKLYNFFAVKIFNKSFFIFQYIEKGFLEFFFYYNLTNIFKKSALNFSNFNTGNLFKSILYLIFFFLFHFFSFIFFRKYKFRYREFLSFNAY